MRPRKFNIRDRLGIITIRLCGEIDCNTYAEPGYGRCHRHLIVQELKKYKPKPQKKTKERILE